METIGIIGIIQRLFKHSGRENGNYTDYRDYTEIMKDNGKENGNYRD